MTFDWSSATMMGTVDIGERNGEMMQVVAVLEVPLLRNFGSRLVLLAIPDVGDGRLLLSLAMVTVVVDVFHVETDL